MTVDISIVGCGPVGATLANLLADFGHSVAIIEKETEINGARFYIYYLQRMDESQ